MDQIQQSEYSEEMIEAMGALRVSLSQQGFGPALELAGELSLLEKLHSQLLTEHNGMADELLRTYEQLGIVFEVTRKLPTVRNEDEVLDLFLESLRITYPQARVITVKQDRDQAVTVCRDGQALPPWICEALITCHDERRVVPATSPKVQRAWARDNCRRGLAQIVCGPIFAGDSFVCALLLENLTAFNPKGQPQAFESSDMQLLDSLIIFCGDMIRNFRLVTELRQLSIDMVQALVTAIEQKDEYTSGHSNRVGEFATMLGQELGLDAAALQMLGWAALLHDVGKIGIRDSVLKKPGKLTPEEFDHIKEHPVRSFNVIRQVPQLADALQGVRHHHECWDGSGYPDGLAGEKIPLPARIVQVADIFDALISTRSYRKAFHWEKAMSILQEEAGTTIDPHLYRVFEGMIRRLVQDDPERFERLIPSSSPDNLEQSPTTGGA